MLFEGPIPLIRVAYFLEYVSHIPKVSYCQIWDINNVQNGAGEPKIAKTYDFWILGQ